jgi:hypothetical protein
MLEPQVHIKHEFSPLHKLSPPNVGYTFCLFIFKFEN